MPSAFHLAQINIGRARGAMDGPVMAGFVARLEDINALADRAPGFVWRLQTEAGDATALRVYEDERILVNLSVWEDAESLQAYVYRSMHTDAMRQRRSWFEKFDGAYYALWWIEAGRIPTVEEAKARLDHLRAHGETERAFSFGKLFPAPDAPNSALFP
jgi:heme-degrading monooxygenase HmoA